MTRVDSILGPVRLCRGCDEEWPLDEDFWYFQDGRPLGRCRACWSERVPDERGRMVFRPLVVTAYPTRTTTRCCGRWVILERDACVLPRRHEGRCSSLVVA